MSICGKGEKERKSDTRNCNGNKKRNKRGIVEENVNGVQERRLRIDRKIWKVLTVYKERKMKDLRKLLERLLGEREEENLCIGEDFNARIGREGKKYKEREDYEVQNSKDKVINSEGKELLDMLEEKSGKQEMETRGNEERK